jgi:D-sedoheptulose 7-phosphate isomerase
MGTVVFTNGCFDLLHPGHVDLLRRASQLGTKLIVGINSDDSIRRIKGPGRPIMNQNDRAAVLSALRFVDEVVVFDESTPEQLIKRLNPDVLVKGGDWPPDEIIGSDFVVANGGKVFSLPLLDGHSSSHLVEKLRVPSINEGRAVRGTLENSLREHVDTFERLNAECSAEIVACAALILKTVENGGKILLCGNGGSAADAQHIAAEFVGRFETARRALPAIALTTDTSALTAISNDYGFERVFARQVEALGRDGDLLIALSTSGDSPNIISAVMSARTQGCKVIGMTGEKGKKLASLCDRCVLVPSARTARIQEAHIAIAHIWCEMIDERVEAGS